MEDIAAPLFVGGMELSATGLLAAAGLTGATVTGVNNAFRAEAGTSRVHQGITQRIFFPESVYETMLPLVRFGHKCC